MKTYIYAVSIILFGMNSFGQEAKFVKPVKLSDDINTESAEIAPISFKNRLYFVRAFYSGNTGGEQTGHDIWVSSKTYTGEWRSPFNGLVINNDGSNGIAGISEDGNTLYLMNMYNTDTSTAGLSVSHKSGYIWEYPTDISLPDFEPTSRIYGIHVDPLEQVVFVSMENEDSKGKEDLFVYTKDGINPWNGPYHLAQLNTSSFEMSPFLGPDRKTLYFSSDRPGGEGSADVYQATRLDDTWKNWSEPENIGSVINGSGFDAYFSIYKDSTVYFSSNRDGNLDIYESELAIYKEEKDKPDTAKGQIVYHFDRDNYVYFDFDEYTLKPAMRNFLMDVRQKMNANKIRQIELKGHTDHIGSEDYNFKLGTKRARTVKKFLVDNGIPANRIKIISYGETKPAVKETVNGKDNPNARAKNRRVRIEILEQDVVTK